LCAGKPSECYFLEVSCASSTSNACELFICHPFHCDSCPTSYGESVFGFLCQIVNWGQRCLM